MTDRLINLMATHSSFLTSLTASLLLFKPAPTLPTLLTSLPLLLSATAAHPLHRTVPALFIGSLARTSPSTWPLMRAEPASLVAAQGCWSFAEACLVGLVFRLQQVVEAHSGDSLAGMIFGLMWAAAWWIWGAYSPLGRLKISSPVGTSGAALSWAGRFGVDALVAWQAHAIHRAGRAVLNRVAVAESSTSLRSNSPPSALSDVLVSDLEADWRSVTGGPSVEDGVTSLLSSAGVSPQTTSPAASTTTIRYMPPPPWVSVRPNARPASTASSSRLLTTTAPSPASSVLTVLQSRLDGGSNTNTDHGVLTTASPGSPSSAGLLDSASFLPTYNTPPATETTRLLSSSPSSPSAVFGLPGSPSSNDSRVRHDPSQAHPHTHAPISDTQSRSSSRTTRALKASAPLADILLALLTASCILTPSSPPLSLSAPLTDITPLAVACILPPPRVQPSLDQLLYESRRLGGTARLHLWPESTYSVPSDSSARAAAITRVEREVARQYGVWVAMAMESDKQDGETGEVLGRRNEVVLLGPKGVEGWHEKSRVVPFNESRRIIPGNEPPPLWTISLPPPKRIPKQTWSPLPSRTRNLTLTPLICLEAFHPALVPTHPALPDIIIVPAHSPTYEIGAQMLAQVQSLSVAHGRASVLCTSGEGPGAVVDRGGRVLFLQRGGGSWSVNMVVEWRGTTMSGMIDRNSAEGNSWQAS